MYVVVSFLTTLSYSFAFIMQLDGVCKTLLTQDSIVDDSILLALLQRNTVNLCELVWVNL